MLLLRVVSIRFICLLLVNRVRGALFIIQHSAAHLYVGSGPLLGCFGLLYSLLVLVRHWWCDLEIITDLRRWSHFLLLLEAANVLLLIEVSLKGLLLQALVYFIGDQVIVASLLRKGKAAIYRNDRRER